MHALYGQTVGKMLTKVKVLDISETPLKFYQAVLRDVPQIFLIILSFIFVNPNLNGESVEPAVFFSNPFLLLTFIWGVADLVVFFSNDKKRALHDYIAGSVVVRIEKDNH